MDKRGSDIGGFTVTYVIYWVPNGIPMRVCLLQLFHLWEEWSKCEPHDLILVGPDINLLSASSFLHWKTFWK